MTINNGITALSNRRGFISLSQHAFGLCKRHNNNAALIYLDLDEHPCTEQQAKPGKGNPALAFARLLSSNFRASDVIGQLAETEFAVFLTNADSKSADISLERFAQRVAEYNRTSERQPLLTYNAGVERVDFEHHHTIDDLLAQSDSNLYRYRQAGKKRSQP